MYVLIRVSMAFSLKKFSINEKEQLGREQKVDGNELVKMRKHREGKETFLRLTVKSCQNTRNPKALMRFQSLEQDRFVCTRLLRIRDLVHVHSLRLFELPNRAW